MRKGVFIAPYQSCFTAITASRPAALRPDTQAVAVPDYPRSHPFSSA